MKFSPSTVLNIPIGIVLVALIYSCKAQQVQSRDFTPEFAFTKGIEGPAVDKEGNLYAVNFEVEGTMRIVDMDGKASLFATLPEGSTGNGIRFDQAGYMYVADYTGHNVLQIK